MIGREEEESAAAVDSTRPRGEVRAMAKNQLDLSDDGLKTLIGYEDEIDGLYNDSSGYCTFGVGHLAHSVDKWSCFILDAARADDSLKSLVQEKVYSKTNKLPYLPRGATASDKYGDLGDKALAAAKTAIAQSLYKKEFDKLKADEQQKVEAKAKEAVDEQKRLLTLNVQDTFKADLKPFIKAVNDNVTGVELGQDEFDALVAFTFNVGTPSFKSSTLLKKINENKYRTGEAKDRKTAMDAIEAEFLKWNKSDGQVVKGLTTRRQAEADLFLKQAKKEYDDLAKAPPNPLKK
jgi:GH24 family phage-related lysozyme (muramidase)